MTCSGFVPCPSNSRRVNLQLRGENKYASCFVTDEVMQCLARVQYGNERLKVAGGEGRGGRGRGRGVSED